MRRIMAPQVAWARSALHPQPPRPPPRPAVPCHQLNTIWRGRHQGPSGGPRSAPSDPSGDAPPYLETIHGQRHWRAQAKLPDQDLVQEVTHSATTNEHHQAAPVPIQLQWQPQPQQRLDPNVWAYKPAWCQPYFILATGTAVVGGVWGISGGSPWWSAAAALPVVAWWVLFLGFIPVQFREYAERVNAEQQQQ